MGHAGAIISGNSGTAISKINALEAAGVFIAHSPAEMGETMKTAMDKY
jgi:succinyl-CoA synthetase alpha subunit